MKVGSRSCIPCSFSVQQHLNPSIQSYHLNNNRSFCRLWGTPKKSVKSPDPPLCQAGHMPSSVTEVVWCLTGMPGHRPRSTGELSISQGSNSFWGFICFYVQKIKHTSKNTWYCAVILLNNATWSYSTCPTYYVTCLVPALYSSLAMLL